MDKISRLLAVIYEKTGRHRTLILGLSVIVVFVATYMLILPAFTLEKTTAAKQGGIDVPGIETMSEETEAAQGDKDGTNTNRKSVASEQNPANSDSSDTDNNYRKAVAGDRDAESKGSAANLSDDRPASNPTDDGKTGEHADVTGDELDAGTVDDSVTEEHPVASGDGLDAGQHAELIYEGDGYDVTIEDTKGVLPEGTELGVREISEDKKSDAREYRELAELAADALRSEKIISGRDEVRFAMLYDITLSADGQEVEPAGDECVGVRISYDKDLQKKLAVDDADNVHIIHFAEDQESGELITEIYDGRDVDVTVRKDRLAETAFAAESFSVYAVVYTVDFHYEVDGKTYDFRIPGGGYVSLSEIMEALGIAGAGETADLMAEVASVEFSDPALVSVSRADEDTTVGAIKDALGLECEYSAGLTEEDISKINATEVRAGDWALISLKSFDTEESLTITMVNGDKFIVRVTDAQHVDDLALMLESAAIYENGDLIPWPATVRENKFYDIRLTFKENSVYQFLDTADEMYYPVPEGMDLGSEDFTHDFAMDVGDGIKLEGNTVKYDAATNRFVIKWNTGDKTAFNKLIASNSAEFRLDFKAKFDFTRDNIEFSENVTGKIIKDTSYDVDVDKTGVYNEDEDRIDYTVTVTSYGDSKDIKVRDELFGTALTYISTGDNHGVSWKTYDRDGNPKTNTTIGNVQVLKTNKETYPDREEGLDCGFEVPVGEMADGDKIEFTYSAAVNYDKLTGSGTYDETFNKVVVKTPTGEKEKDHSFTGNLHYVKLEKDHTRPINWNGDNATIEWFITVNEECKVGMKGTVISDRIYAGDVEAMEYSGSGLHAKVYDDNGTLVGEYDVPWSDGSITKNSLGIDAETDEIEYASWHYTIPDIQAAKDSDGKDVTINNSEHYKYVFSYTTDADKSLMVFDGYIGNEASESKTDNLMQDGFYPPGTGTMPEVIKAVEPKEDASFNAPNGSNEEYIYWTISFDRQRYDLTRCVIEDNNPTLWGTAEPVDVTTADGEYEYLYVEGLTDSESWEVSNATDTRTTIKFYRDKDKKKPGLLRANDEYTGEDGNPSNTITIHLRTKNSATWLDGTLTKYWPRNHTNTVTWIPNAHQVEAEATTTPDVRKIIKNGVQVGTIIRDGVSLPVFRYKLILVGLDENSFPDGTLVLDDKFDTDKLALISPDQLTEANGFEYTQALQQDIGNNRIWTYWDQKLKGYGEVSGWVGPVPVSADVTSDGIQFRISQSDFLDKGLETIDGDKVYCLRYGLPYYLVVKDAEAARAIAKETIDAGKDTAEFGNTVTWNDDQNLKDSTTVKAEFKPAQKSVLYNDQRDLATYQLTLNPQGMRLNDGQMIRVEDAYENLAVDFSTVDIKTVPEDRKSQINWSYHNNKGTFWIPDETVVIITYQAQPIGDAGKNVNIKNELTMLTWKETVEKTVTLNSESEGSAGDYNIRLFKYQDDFMNQPLSGAVFQLFEAGNGAAGDVQKNGRWYKPVTYQTAADVISGSEEYEHTAADIIADDEFLQAKKMQDADGNELESVYPTRLHHNAGAAIYFSTGANGYSDIHLSQSRDGVALERGKQYYLYEVVTPDGYDKEDIYWSFIIDDMDFFDSAHGIYQYRDGGVLTVSNESSQDKGIVLSKSFTGNARDALNWNQVQFEIVGEDKDGTEVFRRDVSFADFVKYKLKLPSTVLPKGNGPYTYTITEKNADVVTATRTTSAKITKTTPGDINNDGTQVVTDVNPTASKSTSDGYKVSFTVTDADLEASSETAYKVAFENNYDEKPVELTLKKEWGKDAAKLDDKNLTLALYKDGEEYGLYKDGDVYKPVALNKDVPKPEATRIVLKDNPDGGTGWSAIVKDLPRYESGKPIKWTVKEVGANFTQDGNSINVSESDMDMQFNITAYTQTGTDENGDPVTETVKIEHAEAQIDTTSSEKANLTLSNELSTMTTVKVEKKWYDEDGKDVTSSKTEDDAVTYDLYRTKDELPKGGKDRETFSILPIDETTKNRIDGDIGTVEVTEGDVLEIIVTSKLKASWGDRWAFNYGGLTEYYSGAWLYAFEVEGVYDENGNSLLDRKTSTDTNHLNDIEYRYNDKTGLREQTNVGYWADSETIVIKVKVDQLNKINKNYDKKFFIRYFGIKGNDDKFLEPNCSISVRNYTQESENLTHAKLENFVKDHAATTELFRENLTLGELEAEQAKWNSTSNYPDGYTYFAIEHTPAGYEDSYSVVDITDADGKVTGQTITIENKPVKIEDDQELGTLTVEKAVTGLPNTSDYNNKEYQFRIKNGAKYLVKTKDAEGHDFYKLMSLAEMSKNNPALTLENDATYSIKAGAGKVTFGGLYPAVYMIEEVGNPQVTGYILETSYTGNGRIGVNLGQSSSATITNAYIPDATSVTFGKLWADGDNKPVAWPEGQSIEVVVHRHLTDKDCKDTSFTLKYKIDANGATLESGSIVPAPETIDNIKIKALTDNASAPYYAYRYELSGLAKKVLTGTYAGDEWTYYVTETVPDGAAYEKGYGTINGTAASVVNGKQNAEAGTGIAFTDAEYIINQFSQKEITFTKNWYDGVNSAALAEWPQREKAKELDENGNVINPNAEKQYEDVPITVTLRRKLAYGPGDVLLTDYDSKYEVTFSDLTSSVMTREQTTSEGKINLKLEQSGSNFTYKISGLRESGSLDGQSGKWKYYVVESAVDGYSTSYELSNSGTPDGSYTDEGGTIRNTKKLGTLTLEKKTEGLPDTEKNKEFTFTVKNSEGKYLKTGGALADNSSDAEVTIKSGEKAVFSNVPAGEYTAAEQGTEPNGSAQLYGYSLVTTYDKDGKVSIADDDVKTVTVTNTYTPETTGFAFTKVWYGVDWSTPTDWMTDSITVTLSRSFRPDGEGAQEINGDPITMTIVPQGGTSGGYNYTVERKTSQDAGNEVTYAVLIQGLEKHVSKDKLPAGVTSGEWSYTLAETVPAGYHVHYFRKDSSEYKGAEFIDNGGKIENRLDTYELPSTGGAGTTLFYLIGSLLVLGAVAILWRLNAHRHDKVRF